MLLFIAPMSFALGSFWSPRLPQAKGLMASAAQMLTAGVLFVLVGLARGEAFTQAPSLTSALALLYLVTFGSLLAYSAYTYLLSCNLRPTLLSSYAYVNPIVAVLLGALVPICGGGDTSEACNLKDIPTWAFHGAKDDVVPPSESIEMVEALKQCGGDVQLTLYPDLGHNSWTRAYNNMELYAWLLQHKKRSG